MLPFVLKIKRLFNLSEKHPVPILHFNLCMYQVKKEPALPEVGNWPLALCASVMKPMLNTFGAARVCVCSGFCPTAQGCPP